MFKDSIVYVELDELGHVKRMFGKCKASDLQKEKSDDFDFNEMLDNMLLD